MKYTDNHLVFSPSDLVRYSESNYASWMDRYNLENPGELEPDQVSEEQQLVINRGFDHEAAFLAELKEGGRDVLEVENNKVAEQTTLEAISGKVEVIFQACLSNGKFRGYADFLVYDPESELYEVWDTKLAGKAKASYLVQLCCYADILECLTGRRPQKLSVVLGNGEQKHFFTSEYYPYYQRLRDSFLQFMEGFDLGNPPVPIARRDHGRWNSHAEAKLKELDHLSQVAGIRQSQVARLEAAGIQTLAGLASTDVPTVEYLQDHAFKALKEQAYLQLLTCEKRGAQGGDAKAEYRPIYPTPGEPPRGLEVLPPADDKDAFFDFEGFPLVEGGLEYLIGATVKDGDGFQFLDWWAHDAGQEKVLAIEFIRWAHARWKSSPGMHLYHYANYEVAALQKLTSRYGVMEAELDDLLRNKVFVDLYKVVKEGVRVGEPSYSIKYIEKLYRQARGNEVATAAQSIVEYARWMESGEPQDWKGSGILKGIRDYNEDDCVSTAQLVGWLRQVQGDAGIGYVPPPTPEEQAAKKPTSNRVAKVVDELDPEAVMAAVGERLGNPAYEGFPVSTLHSLLEYYRREMRPQWWQFFERLSLKPDELKDDLECLGDIEMDPQRDPEPIKRSMAFHYQFDSNQDTKINADSQCVLLENSWVRLKPESIEPGSGKLTLKISNARLEEVFEGALPQRTSLVPHPFSNHAALRKSILESVHQWVGGGRLPGAIHALLTRTSPLQRPACRKKLENVEGPLQKATLVAKEMDGEVLAIQGPPGTGKTYTAANMVRELVGQGLKVGICATSHKAIANLLAAIGEQEAMGVNVVYSTSRNDLELEIPNISVTTEKSDLAPSLLRKCASEEAGNPTLVLAGTAWSFAHPAAEGCLDYLFIEEAGQFSLANAVAVGRATRNMVLLGDQMQLPQPAMGQHPERSGESALGYFLDNAKTVPPELGIFLPESRRMSPKLCSLVSDMVYEGRLLPHESTDGRRVIPVGDARFVEGGEGVLFSPVQHEGNTQFSMEEVERVKALVDELLASKVSQGPKEKPLEPKDIVVITPYNLQVRKLKEALPEDIRVGTVDKFQGQEAEVSILSLAASYGEYGSRGLAFLLQVNRVNVALSRARCLSIVVGDPRIAESPATNIQDMHRLSFLCRAMDPSS